MNQKEKTKNLWLYTAALGGIFLLALFLRSFQLGSIPYGVNVDEAGMGYDAYSILHYGIDRYYKYRPIYLINFGGGQSALYAYVCMVFLKFFGMSVTVLRLPAVLFGMLTVVFGTLLIQEGLGKRAALAGAVLLAVCPYFMMQSRIGLDCNLFLGVSTLALYLLTMAVKHRKWWLYVLAGGAFGVSLYCYALSYFVVPVFLLLAAGYLFYIKKINFRELLLLGVPLGILAAPLMVFVAIQVLDLPEIRTAWFTIPRLPDYRGGEFSLEHVLENVPRLIQCLFFYDSRIIAYNAIPNYFTMYVVSIPFALLGIQKSFVKLAADRKAKAFSVHTLLLCWFMAMLIMGLVVKDPNVNRMNGIYMSLLFFAVYGMVFLFERLKKKKSRMIFLGVLALLYAGFSVSFVSYYFTEYPEEYRYLGDFGGNYHQILQDYAEEIGDKNVYVENNYIYYALGELPSPEEFQLIEQGMDGRGNIHFELPETLEADAFYIFRGTEEKQKEFKDLGFTVEEAGYYYVAYTEGV